MVPDLALAGWLRLTHVPGIGGETQRRLLRAFGGPDKIFSADPGALANTIGPERARRLLETDTTSAIQAALAWGSESDHAIVTLGSPEYPAALLEIPDPPTVLYVNGRVELLRRAAISVVGSRNPTPQGAANASRFAAALAQSGLAVVSGLAHGIDAAAHRGVLETEGDTIAVIGTGIDRIYPAAHRDLAREIVRRGCIVSEFPLGTPAIAGNFPRRNRLISGLSLGTLVVEAAVDSGSLITARLAAEQGREVFAIPGSIHSPLSRGSHALIKQGAKLVETVQDILDELNYDTPVGPALTDTPQNHPVQSDTVLEHLGFDPCSIDTLAARTQLPIDTLSTRLLQLELEGRLSCLPGGFVQRLCAQ
ncbi:DNA-processing protein DprA [Propionivibrio dicarboxylicus]|uniref:DNA processing protein n=1 Tax=Propionivibrio dicarboxylicus TaxID=83767 RepID=A0A1G7W8F3_9RHOO|nr:DNA-processing protein DprA [Propionivibrio dicarboxylicus]SDG68218.1 DNA processing protein [Propionivibrio dicarboxylicus]